MKTNIYEVQPPLSNGANTVVATDFINPGGHKLIGLLKGANMNVTTDQQIQFILGTVFVVKDIMITNASISLTTAKGAFYSAPAKGGTIVMGSTTFPFTQLTTPAKFIDWTYLINVGAGTPALLWAAGVPFTLGPSGIYLSLTTIQGAAATADIYVYGDIIA